MHRRLAYMAVGATSRHICAPNSGMRGVMRLGMAWISSVPVEVTFASCYQCVDLTLRRRTGRTISDDDIL